MRSFSNLFKNISSNPDTLNVNAWRPPNAEHTEYQFDRPVDVKDGSTRFTLKNGEVVVDRLFSSSSDELMEPTEESLDLVNKLRAVNGVQFTSSSIFGDMKIETYKIGLFKSKAVPDEVFDRDVITVLAEHFGVDLDNVMVNIEDHRSRRQNFSSSPFDMNDDNPEEDEWPSESTWNSTRNSEEDNEYSKNRQELAEAARGIRERTAQRGNSDEENLSDVRQPVTLVDEELPGER